MYVSYVGYNLGEYKIIKYLTWLFRLIFSSLLTPLKLLCVAFRGLQGGPKGGTLQRGFKVASKDPNPLDPKP